MNTPLVVPPEVQAVVRKRQYQRRAYLRRKEKSRVLAEVRLEEKAERVKREILAAGGVLQSLPAYNAHDTPSFEV